MVARRPGVKNRDGADMRTVVIGAGGGQPRKGTALGTASAWWGDLSEVVIGDAEGACVGDLSPPGVRATYARLAAALDAAAAEVPGGLEWRAVLRLSAAGDAVALRRRVDRTGLAVPLPDPFAAALLRALEAGGCA